MLRKGSGTLVKLTAELHRTIYHTWEPLSSTLLSSQEFRSCQEACRIFSTLLIFYINIHRKKRSCVFVIF